MLNIINFAHGALYMVGAFMAWLGLTYLVWLLAGAAARPLCVGVLGVVIERTMLQWLYKLDHLYGLLLTFGLAWCWKACSPHIRRLRSALLDSR